MEEILKKIKHTYECMTTDAKGSARGIEILWNSIEFIVDYWIGMKRILTGRFRLIGHINWFLVSEVYGPHITVERGNFLTQMQQLENMHTKKLWLIVGDFNMITSKEENKGGIQREEPDMARFKETHSALKMIDIHTINGKYTWNN